MSWFQYHHISRAFTVVFLVAISVVHVFRQKAVGFSQTAAKRAQRVLDVAKAEAENSTDADYVKALTGASQELAVCKQNDSSLAYIAVGVLKGFPTSGTNISF